MTIDMRWLDQHKSVLLVDYQADSGGSTAINSYNLHEHIQAMAIEAPHMVDTIVDFSNAYGAVPIQTLTHMRRAARHQQPNVGVTIFVSTQDTITRLVELMRRSSPSLAKHSTLARSRNDALSVLSIIRRNRTHTRL